MCACVFVWCVCVCLVNLFRLFSLLQTHANEIEWKRDDKHSGTNRQPHLSLSNTALLTASLSLFLSPFSSPISFSMPPLSLSLSHTHLASLSDTETHRHTCTCSLKSPCTERGALPQCSDPERAVLTNIALSLADLPLTVCCHTISSANRFH